MCGIAGVYQLDGSAADPAVLHAMGRALAHRGPDGTGAWHRGPIGLAHTRLAVIDPDGSPQPMPSLDGRHHLAFNGEILNHADLRRRLPGPWRTHGDTEVLLALYASSGPRALPALRGQFAFAFADAVDQRLQLVRDALGILPLYFHADDRRVAFASEVKALLPVLGAVQVDEEAIVDHLAGRSVPAPFTLLRHVRKVPPGHLLDIGPDGASLVRWWRIPDHEPGDCGPADPVDETEAALHRAVARALVADVPVGAYLSGGLDSSLIAALATRIRSAPLHTFSAGFGDPRHDELPAARQVAAALRSHHHEVLVGPDDFVSLLPQLTWHRDAPLSEPADVAVFRLAEAARPHVTVVLSGEGSDELFAGYPKHRAVRATECVARLPGPLRVPSARWLERTLPRRAWRARQVARVLTADTELDRARTWFAPFTEYERARLLPGRSGHGRPSGAAGGDLLRRILADDCVGWLSDNLLERGDRMTMAASVELRPPFLDLDVVDLAFRLDRRWKVRGATGKWVVREVARRYLPTSIVDRPKVGFRVPLDTWFRGGLSPLAGDLLLGPNAFVQEVLDRAEVVRLVDDHRRGRRNEEQRIWTLLGLEVWHRVVVRGEHTAEERATCR